MVVINGVKYACERCIRGHRVTLCTHTDQPLTMIKPKGRPASQCQHCREQRKTKNLHTNCTCGKKKNHSANCGCHKPLTHCTCKLKKKLADKGLLALMLLQVLIPAVLSQLLLSGMAPMAGPGEQKNQYIVEDVALPYYVLGMFDLFSRETTPRNGNGQGRPTNMEPDLTSFDSSLGLGIAPPTPAVPQNGQLNSLNPLNPLGFDQEYMLTTATKVGDSLALETPVSLLAAPLTTESQPPMSQPLQGIGMGLGTIGPDGQLYLAPLELDMVDRMFPLFPLVGLALLDNEDTLFIEKPLLNPYAPQAQRTQPNPLTQMNMDQFSQRPGLTRPELVLLDLLFDLPAALLAFPPVDPKPEYLADMLNPSTIFSDLALYDFDHPPRFNTQTPTIPEEVEARPNLDLGSPRVPHFSPATFQ